MIDRPRLQNIALRKAQQEKVKPCIKCGHDSFLFDFRRSQTTKTCKNPDCRHVELVNNYQ